MSPAGFVPAGISAGRGVVFQPKIERKGAVFMPLQLDYYYGKEAEQYSFYRIPKILFTDARFRKISVEAKVLYGLLLDRMALSVRNNWLDGDGRVYIIFTIADVMGTLGCAEQKANKLLNELDCTKGVGLVERVRRGLGKPNVIYVKNFTGRVQRMQEGEPQIRNCENHKSGNVITTNQELRLSQTNNTDFNNTDFSDTNQSIYLPGNGDVVTGSRTGGEEGTDGKGRIDGKGWADEKDRRGGKDWMDGECRMDGTSQMDGKGWIDGKDWMDGKSRMDGEDWMDRKDWMDGKDWIDGKDWMDGKGWTGGNDRGYGKKRMEGIGRMEACRERIKRNIDYDILVQDSPYDRERLDGFVELMAETCCSSSRSIRVNQGEISADVVKERFLELDSGHICYVMDCLDRNTARVGNIRAYLMSALFNAPVTISQYYSSLVRHDMAEGFGTG